MDKPVVNAMGRKPIELRGLLKSLPVELGAGNSRLMQINSKSSSMERVHARVLHTMEYNQIGMPLGQGHSFVNLSIPGYCNPIGIIRD